MYRFPDYSLRCILSHAALKKRVIPDFQVSTCLIFGYFLLSLFNSSFFQFEVKVASESLPPSYSFFFSLSSLLPPSIPHPLNC